MDSIQPYIDKGWYTVPLKGYLDRLEDGTKTLPEFPLNWKKRFTDKRNSTPSKLGGTITGKISGIIAIDCDNEVTWKIFRGLDPEYEFIFKSKGKGKECGTVIYEYDIDLANSFSISDTDLQLDFYSDKGFVYLPTTANKTKDTLYQLPKVQSAPYTVKILLKQLAKRVKPVNTSRVHNVITANCLNPLITHLSSKNEFMPGVFKVITPKDFRDLPEYVEKGYLHPCDIPEGRGSEYLSKVSAILGADISIDKQLYVKAMTLINRMFVSPMKSDRLDSTICDPMVHGKACVDNVPIWQEDTEWRAYRLILQSKRQSSLELVFDDNTNTYYAVDIINTKIFAFGRDAEMFSFIETAAVAPPKKPTIKKSIPIANVKSLPHIDFGFSEGDDPTARLLNTFAPTPYLTIFRNPDSYKEKYNRPITTLKYLDSLIPEVAIREYVIRFLKTKLATFNYSPIILYFLGVPGSGKDVFVSLLETILGKATKPTVREFLEVYNSWMLDSYVIHLDEYGDQITNPKDKQEVLGKLKAYSGKEIIRLRKMRTDGFEVKHSATFISTANENPFLIDEDDRRMVFISTPNVLSRQQWVIDYGGVAKVVDKIKSELADLCYYLATEVELLGTSEYLMPPQSEHKDELIADSMYAAKRLSYAIRHGMWSYLVDIGVDNNCPEFAEAVRNRDITTLELEEVYESLTNGKGNPRTLLKQLRDDNIPLKATTRKHNQCLKVVIPESSINPFEGT